MMEQIRLVLYLRQYQSPSSWYTVLILLLVAFSGCKQPRGKIIHTYYESGALKEEYHVINDTLRQGEYKSYYENGVTQKIATYQQGKQNGLVRIWYKNSSLSDSFYVDNDKFEGPFVAYYETGEQLYYGVFKNDAKVYGHYRFSLKGKITGYEYFYPADSLLYSAYLNKDGQVIRGRNKYFELASDFSGNDTLHVEDTVRMKVVIVESVFDTCQLVISLSDSKGEIWHKVLQGDQSPRNFNIILSEQGDLLFKVKLRVSNEYGEREGVVIEEHKKIL